MFCLFIPFSFFFFSGVRTVCKWLTFLHHADFGIGFYFYFRCFSLYNAWALKKNMIAFDEGLLAITVVTGRI